MQVREVLRSKGGGVISIGPEAAVSEAVARMVQNNIGSLPVVDGDGTLVGIFSERDVLRQLQTRGEGFGRVSVSEVMTRDPVTCDLDEDIECVLGKMTNRRIDKVPVLGNDRLVGIISVGDMVKVLYERVRSENDQLMSYIHGTF
jgi:CBS domain-containing protein